MVGEKRSVSEEENNGEGGGRKEARKVEACLLLRASVPSTIIHYSVRKVNYHKKRKHLLFYHAKSGFDMLDAQKSALR